MPTTPKTLKRTWSGGRGGASNAGGWDDMDDSDEGADTLDLEREEAEEAAFWARLEGLLDKHTTECKRSIEAALRGDKH